MRLTFLGTSGGKPTKERNCSAIALECENERGWYLFDCAEGTQRQIIHSHLSALKIKTIFITHTHGDHCYGLPGLLTSMMLDGRREPLHLFGPKELLPMLESFVDVRLEHLGFELIFEALHGGWHEEFSHFTIKALPLIHSIECYAFYIQTKPKRHIDKAKLQAEGLPPGPLYADLKSGKCVVFEGKTFKPQHYVTQEPPQRIIIAGDNAEPAILGDYLKKLDLLVHEATYTQEVYDNLTKELLHTTAKNLAQTAARFGVKRLVATHLSPRFNDPSPIKQEIATYFGGPFWVAEDFMQISL